MFFFLKKQKIEAESPTRRGTHFLLLWVVCIFYVVGSLYIVYCILYIDVVVTLYNDVVGRLYNVNCILYIVYCILTLWLLWY